MKALVFDKPDVVAPWVWARASGIYNPNGDAAIGLVEDGTIIAGVVYESYHPGASIAMHVAAEPGKRWATPHNLKVWFSYPFKQLGVNKVLAPVKQSNGPARRFNEHLGFTLETRVKGVCADGDLLIYSMDRAHCRFLGD